MEDLSKLTNLLNDIGKESKKILQTSLPILKELANEDNDIVDSVIDEHDGYISSDQACDFLRETTTQLTEDAQKVIREIDTFAKFLVRGETEFEEHEEDYPFLAQVWWGDTYPEDKIGGLNFLLEDLRKCSEKMNTDYIIDRVLEQLN